MFLSNKFKSYRVFGAVAAIVGCIALGSISAQTISNGTMKDPYILNTDTVPLGWTTAAVAYDCTTSWDHKIFHPSTTDPADTASLKRRGKGAGSGGSLTKDISGVTSIGGHTLHIRCYIKTNLTSGSAQLAVVTGCGQGGYAQLAWNQLGSVTAVNDWRLVEGWVDVPITGDCSATGFPRPMVTIHLLARDIAGSAWWDSLAVTDLSTNTVLLAPNKAASLRMSAREAFFPANANYTLSVTTTDGRMIRTEKGSALKVRYFSSTPAPGTYLVRLTSDQGSAVRAITVTGR